MTTTEEQLLLDGSYLPAQFRTQAFQLARDTVYYVCKHDHADPSPNETCKIMRSLVDDALKDRLELMHSLVKKLEIKEQSQLKLLHDIASNIFDDEVVNWGRIVTLYAFCGYLARHCEEQALPDSAEDVAKILGDIVVNRLGLWIVAHGGWDGFRKQFPRHFNFDGNGFLKGLLIVGLLIAVIIAFYSSIRIFGRA